MLRVRLGRECTGGSNFWEFDSGIRGLFMVVCLFDGVAASCQVFKALKLVPIVITGWLEVISL